MLAISVEPFPGPDPEGDFQAPPPFHPTFFETVPKMLYTTYAYLDYQMPENTIRCLNFKFFPRPPQRQGLMLVSQTLSKWNYPLPFLDEILGPPVLCYTTKGGLVHFLTWPIELGLDVSFIYSS